MRQNPREAIEDFVGIFGWRSSVLAPVVKNKNLLRTKLVTLGVSCSFSARFGSIDPKGSYERCGCDTDGGERGAVAG
jgi:hypothetical protein